MTPRPPLDELLALFRSTIAREGVTTGAGNVAGNTFIDAGLAGIGANSFVSMLAILYPGDPQNVDSKDITAFNTANGEVTLAGAYKGVAAAIPIGVPYKIITFRFVPAEVAALTVLVDAIKIITDALPDAGALTTIQADLDNPNQYKANVAALALEATLGTHDVDIKALLATIAGYIDTEVGAIETKLDTPANFMADVTALALEATLTAIKGAGFATGTDSLKILSDVLDAITAAGPTNAQMETARDAIIAAIPAMVGTDGAALAASWTAALATALAAYTAVRGGYLEELAPANLPTDITALATSQGRMLFSMDFWSLPQEEVALTIAAGDKALPSVTVADLPGGATIVRAIAMFKFRMVENHTYAGANMLDGAQEIQVAASVDAINFVNTQFTLAESTREGGDVIIGIIDIAATVNANGAYAFHWDLAKALQTGINFNDVQMGIRIWYSA